MVNPFPYYQMNKSDPLIGNCFWSSGFTVQDQFEIQVIILVNLAPYYTG